MNAVRQRLESDDHRAYLQAVRQLPALPRDEVLSILRELAQSHTGRVRARLMNPLREFDPGLANKLAVQILADPDPQFHADALYSLWKTKCPDGLVQASQMLLAHPADIVRLWCATYLGACGTQEQLPVLQQALNDRGTDEEGRVVGTNAEAAIAEIIERVREGRG